MNTPGQTGREKAAREMNTARHVYANQIIDAVVAGFFLILVAVICVVSVREWILLLARKKIAELRETPPVWLPAYAIAETKPLNAMSLLTLGFALAKELSGEAELDRAQQAQLVQCPSEHEGVSHLAKTDKQIYVEATKERFNGVTRCC
jgi:hypothetical protein